jgi:hypothetical protein
VSKYSTLPHWTGTFLLDKMLMNIYICLRGIILYGAQFGKRVLGTGGGGRGVKAHGYLKLSINQNTVDFFHLFPIFQVPDVPVVNIHDVLM